MEQTFGQRLAELRGKRGMSQEELADASGLARPRISLLENDEVGNPRVGTLQKLAQALGVPAHELNGTAHRVTSTQPAQATKVEASPLSIVAESELVKQLKEENRELREQLKFMRDLMRSGADLSKLGPASFILGSHEAAEPAVFMEVNRAA